MCIYICKYVRGKKWNEKREKRVSETYFSSFISPERKENSVTSTAAEGRLPPTSRPRAVPSFDSVYFSRFRIFLVHYQREATIHTAALPPPSPAYLNHSEHPPPLPPPSSPFSSHPDVPPLDEGLLLHSVLREQCKR